MKNIVVSVGPQTTSSKLYPRYDKEAEVLAISSTVQNSWPFGVDIDGTIIFDIGADNVLANIDLLVPKKMWKEKWGIDLPRPSRSGGLMFSQETITQKSFHLPIDITTNKSKSIVSIVFGEKPPDQTVVSLSEKCFALLNGKLLNGFLVLL